MPPTDLTTAAATAAAMDGETPAEGFLRNLGLILGIDPGFFERATAVGTAVRQRDVVRLVDAFLGRGRRPMAMRTMLGTGFATRFLGRLFGRTFGKGRRLPLARTEGVLKQPPELLKLLRQRLDLSFQFADASLQNQTLRARLCHAFTLAPSNAFSCASLPTKRPDMRKNPGVGANQERWRESRVVTVHHFP